MKLEVKVRGQGISNSIVVVVNVSSPVSNHVMQERANSDDSIIGYVPALHRGDRFQRFYLIHLAQSSDAIPREDNMEAAVRKEISSTVKNALLAMGGMGGYSIHRTYDALFYTGRLKLAPPLEGGALLKQTAKKGLLGIIKTIFS